MNGWTFVLRSLVYHRRSHFGVVAGAAVAAAVLVGALTVGDSVRNSLREQALARIGKVDAALIAHERFFEADLADRVGASMGDVSVAPILKLSGIARSDDGSSRAGITNIWGVDQRFFALGPTPLDQPAPPSPGSVFLNERLSRQLGAAIGDEILIRIEKPSLMPRDMLMATIDDVSFAVRVKVESIIGDAKFGRFGLFASQVPPFNVFVPLDWLQERLDLDRRVNGLLLSGGGDGESLARRADRALQDCWTLADAELRLREEAGGRGVELLSGRVFIEPAVTAAALDVEENLTGALTYFVNEMRVGDRTIPYSTVTAIGPLAPGHPPTPVVAAVMPSPGELTLGRWAADDLGAEVGATVEMTFYVMTSQLRLDETSRTFEVGRIVPMEGLAADRSLMPDFPGLADSENCRDWEPSIPVDLDRIRANDEEYWDRYRGTPKAFLPLPSGRAIFANRFGDLTAIRGPAAARSKLAAELPRRLSPRDVGLYFFDVRGPALAVGTSSTDFGGLFLGLSFFLIAAALLLAALLFTFQVLQRTEEIGALLALGLRPRRIRRLLLTESGILALCGGVIGIPLGIGYAGGVLSGLRSLWRDAVGDTAISLHIVPMTLLTGSIAAAIAVFCAIALAMRGQFRATARDLLASRPGEVIDDRNGPLPRSRAPLKLTAAALAGAIVVTLIPARSAEALAAVFFGAGSLVLVAGLALTRWFLTPSKERSPLVSVQRLAQRQTQRRPGRSLATVSLLACGVFLVLAVQAYRLEPPPDPSVRKSGTGGFALIGRSTLPVLRDLGSQAGRDAFGLDTQKMGRARIVPFRVRDGEDASCLNLNQPKRPELLGVEASQLSERGAFKFAETIEDVDQPWQLLERETGGVIPAIGDAASITWILKKKIGDTIRYADEHGRSFDVRIVATLSDSILQGRLIIDEAHFRARFPSTAGYEFFLLDGPQSDIESARVELDRALEDVGLELVSTPERLAEYHAVQNTYLMIFQALGGLGLLLGSLGMGCVVLRNALERRSELAIARAVGFRMGAIRRLLTLEHAVLLALGLLVGLVAAAMAVGIQAMASGTVILVLGGVGAVGGVFVFLAAVAATRGPLLESLRDE